MSPTLRIPYTQQFTPKVTPIRALLGILRQYQGKRPEMKKAIASAFHGKSSDPEKMASNTLASLKVHGVIDDTCRLTQLGAEMVAAPDDDAATDVLTKNLLVNLGGMMLVETLREMKQAGVTLNLASLKEELRHRGFAVSDNSSDLSGVLGWLRASGVLSSYEIQEARYSQLVGAGAAMLAALKDLTQPQVAFLRALVALGVTDWTPHNSIVKHAEALFAGEVSFNWKDLDRMLLQPLAVAGLILLRKATKKSHESRGGKAQDVKPTEKFEQEVAEPILAPLYAAAGFKDVRTIRSIPFDQLVADVRQKSDIPRRARSLEILAIRICQLLALDFMGWRETDENLVAGGEVDGFMHTTRLVYSRWQIQCKATSQITLAAIAKEVGISEVTLANVILMVSTGPLTASARTYRKRIVSKMPLNIVVIDGLALQSIAQDQAAIVEILNSQARDAMTMKPKLDVVKPPSNSIKDEGEEGEDGGGEEVFPVSPEDPSGSATGLWEEGDEPEQIKLFKPYYTTSHGQLYLGDSYDVLQNLIEQGVRAKLIVTSPPFALLRKKEYGNEDQERYVEWFMRYAPLFHRILESNGSFVLDIGGAWLPGIPARSLYQYDLLIRLCQSHFYLAQEFFHYNPARLPTPAEWVTVRRIRVKDAVNNVWWFVKEPFVDSDNSRVLREYSESMKSLLKNGYEAKLRPSGHNISENFNVDHGGSIPPNLIVLANTESNSHYLRECKRAGIKAHPARFPVGLPEFFINFLTQPGDLVIDPFAGSNVTGEAAQALGRRWIGIELLEEYAQASQFRFDTDRTATELTEAQPQAPNPSNFQRLLARAE